MNVDSIRHFCLCFPESCETLQWGETLCFKFRRKLFALLSLNSVPPSLTLKASPEEFAVLLEQDGIIPAAYLGRYEWVTMERLDALPRAEVEALLRQSYEMVAAKAPKTRGSRRKASRRQPRRRKPARI